MLWIGQEVPPSPFTMCMLASPMTYVLGLCIVNVLWCRNSDGFLTMFTSEYAVKFCDKLAHFKNGFLWSIFFYLKI